MDCIIDKYRFRSIWNCWCHDCYKYFEINSDTTCCPDKCPNGHAVDIAKSVCIAKIEKKYVDQFGKQLSHDTTRDPDFTTVFVGCDDDNSDIRNVGGGKRFIYRHSSGQPLSKEEYYDFNLIENRTKVHEGYVNFNGCDGDYVDLLVVPTLVNYEAGENTSYFINSSLFGEIIVPSELVGGAGNINITSDLTTPFGGLIFIPEKIYGTTPARFWNADWDAVNKEFKNIESAPNGDGEYNMFYAERVLSHFVHSESLFGTGAIRKKTSDTDEIGQGMRIKIIYTTDTTEADHEWHCGISLTMFREKTCKAEYGD